MSGSNQILLFANDASATANLETQANWLADALRLTGFIAGRTDRKKFNKAMRQASLMAYVMAQGIVDSLGEDVLDDGNPATLLAQYKRAIIKLGVGSLHTDHKAWPGIAGGSITLDHTPGGAVMSLYVDGVKVVNDGSVYTIPVTTALVIAANTIYGTNVEIIYD